MIRLGSIVFFWWYIPLYLSFSFWVPIILGGCSLPNIVFLHCFPLKHLGCPCQNWKLFSGAFKPTYPPNSLAGLSELFPWGHKVDVSCHRWASAHYVQYYFNYTLARVNMIDPSYFNQGETWYTSNTFFQRLVNGSRKLINLTKGEAYMVHYYHLFLKGLWQFLRTVH